MAGKATVVGASSKCKNEVSFVSRLEFSISRLAEVGKLEPVKLQGNYDTGQMFLHNLFGYRGVILFPWLARVYDRDMPSTSTSKGGKNGNSTESNSNNNATVAGKEVKGKTHMYYQVENAHYCILLVHTV